MRLALSALLVSLLTASGCALDTETTASTSSSLAEVEGDHDHESVAFDAPLGSAARLTHGEFGFTMLDIGQGDSAVVLAPHGCVALLDAGPQGSAATIKSYLHSLGVTQIDFAVVSHYHEDHLGGLDDVERGDGAIPIAKVYDRGGSYSSATYTAYTSQFRDRRTTVAANDHFSLCGEVSFAVMAADANGASTNDENARSVAVKVSFGSLDILVGGDLTSRVEDTITSSVGEIEIYKVHHHGSAGSSSAQFLAGTRPTVSLISVAEHNSYGHPTQATLSRLDAAGSAVWRTAGSTTTRGHIEVSSTDGHTYTVTKNNDSTTYTSKPD